MGKNEEIEKIKPKHRDKFEALDNLSLGISMVAAVVIGFGIGYGLKTVFEIDWLLWLGVFWGVSAAILNIYKAYKRAQKSYEGMENDPRYAHRAKHGDKVYGDDED